MTKWVLAAAMFTAVGWLTGCATMIYGTTQSISVTSEPVGAEVWTKGQFLATTPTTLTLRRKSDYDIEIKKEGFEVARVRLESKSEHDASSILLGGPIGWGIDVSSRSGQLTDWPRWDGNPDRPVPGNIGRRPEKFLTSPRTGAVTGTFLHCPRAAASTPPDV